MRHWLLNLTTAVVPFAPAAPRKDGYAANIQVKVHRMRQDGKSFYRVNAQGFARAAPQVVWNVLTDYDRLHEFVPNLNSSKLLSRNADEAVIEQNARAGFLFIKQSIYLEMRVIEMNLGN